ncbi:hypothetical protein FKR81_20195 [Lentzea tibetensis]|uniref:Uncharacterized protein n=1 Tax=Lentzea tibetensis TaxID=2591470 RepID=A0A563ES19_9PSEU|nr:hypothetical protein [Lentzea tibetensis]TWP50497.1 hypothetical protein FKR81_20195 [Lentzea tibetensis]
MLSIVTGLVLGVLSLNLTSFDFMWNAFGVPRDLRAAQSTGLGILFLCTGFLLALYFQQEDFRMGVLAAQQAEMARVLASWPAVDVFRYQTGEEAMTSLTARIADARTVINTRIASPKLTMAVRHGPNSPWDLAVRRAVAEGLTFREVVSTNHADLARDRSRGVVPGGHGVYEAVVIRNATPVFMNFTIFEYRDGTKEMWFGWAASRTSGFEATVVRTAEARIVALFEHWHADLFSSGQPVK